MTQPDNPDDLEGLFGAYEAPGPRPEFVRHLRSRLESELVAARTARRRLVRLWTYLGAAAAAILVIGLAAALLTDNAPPPTPVVSNQGQFQTFGTPRQIPFTHPDPRYACTPRAIPTGPHIEPYPGPPGRPVVVSADTRNLALGKPVTSSDPTPIVGGLDLVTDGEKRGTDMTLVELAPGLQWVQIDLEQTAVIDAIAVWHYPATPRAYHDVIVQVSADPHFRTGVVTVFNNDYDNSAGLGAGEDMEYVEDYRGRVIQTDGLRGRYVRLYSNGNIDNEQNHYVEVEVYGRAANRARPL